MLPSTHVVERAKIVRARRTARAGIPSLPNTPDQKFDFERLMGDSVRSEQMGDWARLGQMGDWARSEQFRDKRRKIRGTAP